MVISIITFIIGTILAILFIVQLKKGDKYSYMFENLDEEKFPAKDLYTVGMAWSVDGPIKMGEKNSIKLKTEAGLLYGIQYAEYYANVSWAQTIMFVHLLLAFTFLLASLMDSMSTMILAVGCMMSAAAGVNYFSEMEKKIDSRTNACELELPEIVSTMAILVNSGMTLRDTWNTVAFSREGEIYTLMRNAISDMNNGKSDIDAIYHFGRASNSGEIKKFTSALTQSMEKGGGDDLSLFLASQSSELWMMKRQKLLQAGEKAASKLLAPIVIIFVGIMIIVVTAAFAGSVF